MRRLLQSIIHNRKTYDRPQDEWVCGRAAEGCACVFGPGKRGECRATAQCMPAKQGDRWVCTRLISLGGKCDRGPNPDGTCSCPVPPCRPVRSLRSLRRRFTWLTIWAAVGVSILVLGGTDRERWTSPGPLTSQHATSAQRCSDCHVVENLPPLTAAGQARHNHAHNQLCLNCHDLGPEPATAHGAGKVQLARLTATARTAAATGPMILAVARELAPPAQGEIACATCHSEHHGRAANLKVMAAGQCQTCHQQQFASFNSGHPEFSSYPYERRTRLQFDHATHWQKHFVDARFAALAPTSCTDCHAPAENGGQMKVKGFAQACAACHGGQIAGEGQAGDKGVAFFRLPAFDLATIKKSGADPGSYPAYAEGELTPFMRWMLEGDPAARAALATLGARPPGDLSQATAAQTEAAATLLWSVKGLFADLVTQGQQVLLRRLGASAKADPAMAGRTGQLPADNLLAAQQAWLPDLLAEVAAHRRGEKFTPPAAVAPPVTPVETKSAPAAAAPASDDLLLDDAASAATAAPAKVAPAPTLAFLEAEQRVARGGWYRRDETYALYYRPSGHADPFLTAWLDASVGDAAPTSAAIFAQLSAPDAPGLCLKCHTVDATPAGTIVNWYTRQTQPAHHPFTKFKHTAHFSLVGDQGCMTCHVLNPKHEYPQSFGANRDPAVFHSNWVPMTKDTCASCHRPGVAGTGCLQCHDYHTGDWLAPKMRGNGFHEALEAMAKGAEPPAPGK